MATDLDVPVLMSADHIRHREFVAVRRGYDPTQVREFLDKIAAQIEQMATLLRDARMEAETAARTAPPRTDPYEEFAERVAGVLRAASDEAENIRREAASETDRILAEAGAEAERTRSEAEAYAREVRANAEAALQEARERADQALTGLSARRDELIEQLASMQARLVGVAREIESTISVPGSAASPAASADAIGAAAPDVPTTVSEPSTEASDEVAEADGAAADGIAAGTERMIVLEEAGGEEEPDPTASLGDGTAFLEQSLEHVWDGTEAISLDVPDIPPLDLDWGDGAGDDDRPR